VYAYQQVLAQCQAVLVKIQASTTTVNAAIATTQTGIDDRRSAVATTRALLAQEQARVALVNATRTSVIATQAPYLAYVRARFFDGVAPQPQLSLDPALLESPVPGCLAGHDDAPEPIAQMIALLKEAPLSWLKLAPPILTILNRVDLVQGLVITARTRAQQQAAQGFTVPFVATPLVGSFGPAITSIGRAQVDSIWQPRAAVATFDLRTLVGLSWTESRDTAQLVTSLGDLLAGDHLRSEASVRAQAILSNIEKVAGCIWSQVGQVLPVIRLAWANALDEYNASGALVTLTALPRWLDVPATVRETIEALCEWLLTQIDTSIAAAVAWIHDLVRACILLASFAPVDQIVTGSIAQAAPAGPGQLVPVQIDPTKVRVGMQVSFFQGNAVVASGVVENLVGVQAQTRVSAAVSPGLRVDPNTRARFAVAGSVAVPLTRELM
jgi:hypothetical protein